MFKIRRDIVRKPLEASKHMDIAVDGGPRAIPGPRPCTHSKVFLSETASGDRTIWVGGGSKIQIRSFRIENSLRVPHGPEIGLHP